jgi:murein L,D-transpeptidase YafK
MIYKATIILLFFLMCSFQSDSFKDLQKKYARVRKAYNDKEANMIALLKNKKIDQSKMEIYIRAFKSEKELELWGKNTSDQEFLHIKTYTVCATSGLIGPKRMQGDLQIPEGFYYIDRFNPYSNFYLSLGINYPNTSDRILGDKNNLGGDIFIHGDCVTIGCLPITDSEIKELYIFCVEAKKQWTIKNSAYNLSNKAL